MKRFVLASKSPRRKQILRGLGVDIEIVPSDVREEDIFEGLEPANMAVSLALQKAEDVAKRLEYPALVIGADTIVVLEGQVMGKPKDQQHAFQMLRRLTGKTHTVITGVALIDCSNGTRLSDYQCTSVKMKDVDNERIWKYIKTGEPLDKAGAYAVQGNAAIFVEGIEGCFFNVMGLPVGKLDDMLRSIGIDLLE